MRVRLADFWDADMTTYVSIHALMRVRRKDTTRCKIYLEFQSTHS